MSTVSQGSGPVGERSRQFLYRHFQRQFEAAARLSEMDLPPADFYRDFFQRVLTGVGGLAGAIWSRPPSGQLQLDFEINRKQIGLEEVEVTRRSHELSLHQVCSTAQPVALAPSPIPPSEETPAGNFTQYGLLLSPILVDKQVVGLLEVWQEAPGDLETQNSFLHFLGVMAHYASLFLRHQRLRALTEQQQHWNQLERFSQQVHDSLDLAEVASITGNEGRLLVGCDRLSIVARRGRRTVIEAISGVDVVEPRSNQVRCLRQLGERILDWGEPLVFRGTADASLPPEVQASLDAYLAESNCQLLVALPLRDRTAEPKPARFALVLECFEPVAVPDPLRLRLEVIGRHARTALENAARYQRIPLRKLAHSLAWFQESLCHGWGIWLGIAVAVLFAALAGLPYPLKMEAQGHLLMKERRWLYAPVEGRVVQFAPGLLPGSHVLENQSLVLMHDVQLELKIVQLSHDIASAQEDIAALTVQQNTGRTEAERLGFSSERQQKEYLRNRKVAELKALRERTHADETRPGYFWLKSPLTGTVLNSDFEERLTNRLVKPSEPLLRIGDKDRGWEVELKIPNQHLGQVLEAFAVSDPPELDVDLVLLSSPTRKFKGKLARSQLASEASPETNASNPGSVVRAWVRIDGLDLDDSKRIPRDLLVTGTELHARIRCGDRRLGYALFHGVWEFLYEKVLLF